MPIWTDEPDSFAVNCPDSLFLIQKLSFPVHVEDSTTHAPVSSGYVCLWKANEVYLTGYTDVNGDVTFNPLTVTSGTMFVTVTKHNYLPSQKQVGVSLLICGDITRNGAIDLGDPVFLISYLYRNGPAPHPIDLADVNMDGVVNLADVVYLISYLYKNGPAPCSE
jgi:hypothetical protein